MRVLITGGAGFIGSHVTDLLIDEGYDVTIIDNLSNGKMANVNPKAKLYNIDIRDEKVLDIFKAEKPDVLIHHAAQIKVQSSISNPMLDASVNIIGTLNLLEASRKSGVKKVIYPASAAIFGEPQYLPIDENHPLKMISGYGVTKHTIEHYLSIYKHLYDIDYVVLRYSNVYGPRQDSSGEGGVVAIFAQKILRDERPHIFGNGEQVRDFVYVKDVARANLMAINTDKIGIYNVCTNQKVTINELLDKLNNIAHKKTSPIYLNEREGDVKISYMTFNRILNEIGWKPLYNIFDGLEETIDFYKRDICNIV